MIKNIIFDMGQVLIHWTPDFFINRTNLPEEDKEILLNNVYRTYHWQLMDYGYYQDADDFLNAIKDQIPDRLWDTAVKLTKDWTQPGIEPVEGMAEMIKELKDKGYKIYLLSNAGTNHKDYWPGIKGHELFDGVVVSAFEKQWKPCINIYETLLSRYNLKADECVFLDDLPANCATAFLCGIRPIVFRNTNQAREELHKLNVL